MASNFPDFVSRGYSLIRELGRNYGRVTYLAQRSTQLLVIKHFQFHHHDATWAGYASIEREVKVLQSLDHPGIPRYIASFATDDGFCLVQEYKQADSLATKRTFSPEEVKLIAMGLLEVLVYLQSRSPFICHRDIKPENVLVDRHLNVFLVDFGLAHLGIDDTSLGTVARGTLGFIAPEILFHRQVGLASDLYGLGATLICLITGIRTADIGNLVDENYRLNFQHLVPHLSLRWLEWLARLVEIKPQDRYPHAQAALAALAPIYVIRLPQVQLPQTELSFVAQKLGQRVTRVLAVHNHVPETILEGYLSLPQDDRSSWIKLHRTHFVGNQWLCRITVDTSMLLAGQTYDRTLTLHTNAHPAEQPVSLRITTAPFPVPRKQMPWLSLLLLFFFGATTTWLELAAWNTIIQKNGLVGLMIALSITTLVIALGIAVVLADRWLAASIRSLGRKLASSPKLRFPYPRLAEAAGLVLALVVAWPVANFGYLFREQAPAALAIVDALVFLTIFAVGTTIKNIGRCGFGWADATTTATLTLICGVCLGIASKTQHPWGWLGLIGAAIPLAGMLVHPALERLWRIRQYRRRHRHLVTS